MHGHRAYGIELSWQRVVRGRRRRICRVEVVVVEPTRVRAGYLVQRRATSTARREDDRERVQLYALVARIR